MYSIQLRHVLGAPWAGMSSTKVGDEKSGATPGVYVTVELDDVPLLRIDCWPLISGPFTQVEIWADFVVLGWNDRAHLIHLSTQDVRSFLCDGYFGHFYPAADHLLIADATYLVCINRQGQQVWKSEALGIDGVVVDMVSDDEVVGQGEWDPPGGWRPFCLSLTSGQRLLV